MKSLPAGLQSLALVLTILVALPVGTSAQEGLLPLQRVIAIVAERYEGEVIAAEVDTADRHEPAGFVYELRLITPRSNVLEIRIDARSGAFLEVDGRGLVHARRAPGEAVR